MKKAKIISIIAVIVLVISLLGSSAILYYNLESSPLPKLYFEGNISEMHEKTDIRNISIKYESNSVSFSGYAEIKVQGTSSLAYEKKNYTINFFQNDTHTDKLKIDLGWGEQSKYCLKANWIDKTHARNIITANLATEIQSKYNVLPDTPANGAIDGFPIQIYSNGKFLGIYTLNIPKDAWMFNMDKDNPDHIVVCGEGWEDANFFKAMPTFETWAVEVGPENDETLNKLSVLFDFIQNSSNQEFKTNFESYINLDSALTYCIISDFAYLRDNQGKNMLLATYDGKKWYPLLYDLDTSWGTNFDGKSLLNYHKELNSLTEKSLLFSRLSECFGDELSQRYFELRQDILTKDNILNQFNEFLNSIPSSVFLCEKIKWGLDIPGYDLTQIEEYLDTAIEMLDEKYSNLS